MEVPTGALDSISNALHVAFTMSYSLANDDSISKLRGLDFAYIYFFLKKGQLRVIADELGPDTNEYVPFELLFSFLQFIKCIMKLKIRLREDQSDLSTN